ncbi:MAG: copper amine oxidase N-terminal domain-containing protein [Peptococcaceae bacterium]|jgi:hypothetical protein|nr:copper amine oxidase N-terminal domain-containing protein [Peptococcaceae bacterium]
MKVSRGLSILLILVILINAVAFPAAAQSDIADISDIKVTINGVELSFDVPPQIIDGRTLVPMRGVFEALGADVNWDASEQTITATKEDIIIIMKINDTFLSVRGGASSKDIILDVPPQLIDSRTLVPVRAVAESLDADVVWNGEIQTVEIVNDYATPPSSVSGPKQEQSLLEQPAKDPLRGVLYGYGNSRLREVQYVARYIFEQDILSKSFYANEDTIIDFIRTSNLDDIKEFILLRWAYTISYLVSTGNIDPLPISESENSTQVKNPVEQTVQEYELYADQYILEITIEEISADTKAVFIKMSEPGWALLCTHIAIVQNDAIGLQYFTLERSVIHDGTQIHMFCFINENSRGTFSTIENSKEAFLHAIKGAVL